MTEETKRKFQEAGLDLEGSLARFMNKEDLYERFLKKFLDDRNFEDLKNALKDQKYEEAFRYAHTIKGVAGNLGLTPLYEGIQPLVEDLRHQTCANLDEELSRTEADYELMVSLIKNMK